jgi:hypothetical protein
MNGRRNCCEDHIHQSSIVDVALHDKCWTQFGVRPVSKRELNEYDIPSLQLHDGG